MIAVSPHKQSSANSTKQTSNAKGVSSMSIEKKQPVLNVQSQPPSTKSRVTTGHHSVFSTGDIAATATNIRNKSLSSSQAPKTHRN
jgi:hypothetical protein